MDPGHHCSVTQGSRPREPSGAGGERSRRCNTPSGCRAAGRRGDSSKARAAPAGGGARRAARQGGSLRPAARPQGWRRPDRLTPTPRHVSWRHLSSAIAVLTLILCLQGRAVCGTDRGTGTCWAMAHIQPTRSRAIAPTTWWACFPRARRRRTRVHHRPCACQRLSWSGFGRFSRRRGRGRLTVAGSREAQAPAISARRAWVGPVLVMPPCRRGSPLADADGVSPSYLMSGLGGSQRVRAPSAAPVGPGPGVLAPGAGAVRWVR